MYGQEGQNFGFMQSESPYQQKNTYQGSFEPNYQVSFQVQSNQFNMKPDQTTKSSSLYPDLKEERNPYDQFKPV